MVFLACALAWSGICWYPGAALAGMYDYGDEEPQKSAVAPSPRCGAPPPRVYGWYPPMMYGTHPYGMWHPPHYWGTALDDTRRGVQYLDISGGR